MKESKKRCKAIVGARRVIAILVAISMLLIPVEFPGLAHAVGASTGSSGEVILPQNYFYDDFSDSKYMNGVTYQWDFSRTGQSYIRDGKYYLDPDIASGGYVYYNFALLRATATDPKTKISTDITTSWKDYTVEADVNRVDNTVNVQGGVMGRVSVDPATGRLCYYTFVVRDGDSLLYKSYVDSTGAYKNNQLLGRPSAKSPGKTTTHIAMEFSGNTIKCYANGSLVYTYVDDGTYGAPLTSGTAGMYVTPNNALVSYDNFRVSYSPEATAFFDDFSDERYVEGYTYQWVDEPGPEQPKHDVTYNWGEYGGSAIDGAIADGRFSVQTQRSAAANYLFLNAKTVGDADPFAVWTDYTVEADVQRVNAAEGGDGGLYLLGRVNGDGSFYALQYYGEISLWRFSGGLAQSAPTGVRLKNVGFVGRAYDGQIHMEMSFSGDQISVYAVARDEQGQIVKETNFTVTDSTYTSGGIAMLTKGHSGDTNEDGPWIGYWDNLKVTLENGTVVLDEKFDAENHSMDADGMTVESIYEIPQTVEENWTVNGGVISTPVPELPQDVTYTWDKSRENVMSGGVLTSGVRIYDNKCNFLLGGNFTQNLYLDAVTEDGTDFDAMWTDYTVEAEIQRLNALNGTNGLGGDYRPALLGRVNGDGSYYALCYYGELRLFKYVNGTKTDVSSSWGFVDRKSQGTVHLSMTFEGEKIKVTATYTNVDGVVEKTSTKEFTDNTFESGTIGIGVGNPGAYTWQANFDNVKVTLADGTVVFDEPINGNDNSMDGDGLVMERLYTPPAVEEEEEESTEPEYTYTWQVGTGSELTGSVVEENENNWFAVETNSTNQYWSYLQLLDTDGNDAASQWTDYTISADVKREKASERDTALALVGRLNIESGGCYVLTYNGETVKLFSFTGYHTDGGLYAKNDYRKMVQYSADKWRDCALNTGLNSAANTTVHIYMTFAGNDITYGYSYVLDGMTYSQSKTVTVSTICTNHCDKETEIDADLDATCAIPVHTKGHAGMLIQGFYQDWGPDCSNSTADDADGAGVYYVDNYSVVMDEEVAYMEDYEPEQPEEDEEEEPEEQTLLDKHLIKLLDSIPKANATGHKIPALFADWGGSDGLYTIYDGDLYKWKVGSDSLQSYSAADGKLNIQTHIGNKVFMTQLVNADGTAAGRNWTDYTITADVTRTNGNESASTYLIGRIQEDGSFYALDYYGSDISLYKHHGGAQLDAQHRTRLLNKGTGVPRDYEGTVKLTLKFEGNVITIGISYTDEAGEPYSATYSYTDTENAYMDGSIGMLVQSWYADLKEDGAFSVSFDNITVADANDNILFAEDFSKATVWADYGLETDFRLDSPHSTAGIILRYMENGYYELRVSDDTVALYLVSGENETLLKQNSVATSAERWHFIRASVKADEVACYIDGNLALNCDGLDDLLYGTVGLAGINGVSFDNFALYPIENISYRGNATYLFAGDSAAEFESNWLFDDVADWTASDGILSYNGSGEGFASLRRKNILENFYAEILANPTAADTAFSVYGRVSEDMKSYYKLTLDIEDGITLSKTVNAEQTESVTVGVDKLYEKGIKIVPGVRYALRLSMYDNVIEAYLDGQRALSFKDDASGYLRSGVSAIGATAGVEIASLTIAESTAPVKLSIVDKNGKELDLVAEPMQVAAGKVPDIKYLYVNVDNGTGEMKRVPLDTLPLTNTDGTKHTFDYSLATGTTKTVVATYDDQTVAFRYTVVDRAEMIAQLDADLTALDVSDIRGWDLSGIADVHQIYENLTNAQRERIAEVYALADRYDDLSAAEKARVTDGNGEKLANALKTIELKLYPQLENSPVIWEDDFDNSYMGGSFDDRYTHDQYITYARNNGYWFLENGTMFQYSEDDTVDGDTTFEGGAMINNKKYSITSVSGDVQIVSDRSWVGIYANAMPGGEYYRLSITDKDLGTGDRVVLTKGIYALAPTVYLDKNFFEVGQWYNLRLTIEDGWVRGYVDDVLYFEVLDEPNLIYDLFEEGTAGFWCAEGWGNFDNLTVHGEILDENFDGRPQFNENLPAGTYNDDFEDESANVNGDPSHWIEVNTRDQWKLGVESGNTFYALSDNLNSESHTWLHVLETDVDYKVSLRVPQADRGYFPVVGMTTRLNTTDSYIRTGYDFYLQKWFIKYRLGCDFEEVTLYSEADAQASEAFADGWVTVRTVVAGNSVTLYKGDTQVLSAKVGTKVGPGRVGIFAERCNLDADNVVLTLTSGQGTVQDGVLEYYAKSFGFDTGLHQYIEVPNKDDPDGPNWLLAYGSSGRAISKDGGKTFTMTSEYSHWVLDSTIKLNKEGYYLTVQSASYKNDDGKTVTRYTTHLSKDYGATWTSISTLPTDPNVHYSQPARTMNEIKLPDGSYRLFFTANNNSHGTDRGTTEGGLSETYYTDDYGYTWHKSRNGLNETSGIGCFTETMVIQRSDGVLVHLSSYTSAGCIRYSLSHDYGETWEGDYALPQFVSPRGSLAIVKDPYETEDVWYMTVVYNHGYSKMAGNPRNRIALFRSYDGIQWYFLCDVDRWEQTGDGGRNQLLHSTNMYLTVTEDHVFPTSARSEEYRPGNNANFGIVWRFEKDKLVDQPIPAEYVIDDYAVTHIEAVPAAKNLEVTLNSQLPIAGNQIKIHYYNAEPAYVPMEDAFVEATTNALGEQTVTVDYQQFRCLYAVEVVAGDAPVISGAAEDKTYCIGQEVTVSDANGDLESVTLNGEAVTLVNGKFTVTGKEGQQTIVATDKAGNVTTVKITVNAAHTGGEATCCDKAKCDVCGEAYGEKNADKHTKEAKWTITADKHSKAYECCGAVVVEEAAHSGGEATCEHKAKCEVCNAEYGKLAAHKGGEATCCDKAVCDVCGEAYGEKNADKHTKEAKWTITADKHSKAYECCGAVVVEEAAHTGGEATCEHKAKCEVCNAEYGKLADHKGGTATCTNKAKCDVCGESHGEKNADKHTKEAKWTITADKHSKAYECCGKVVVAEEAHEWSSGKCEECGYEAAPGTAEKPIEIPADKETVKAEAKVEAGDELHYELDEKMAGMTITIKGEGAYAIIEGKKYEAVNGVLEVKLPAKTGKIPVIIGNAGTKAGTFSITIATPSENNSDTGDNTAIVLFGSLMALSVLAAGVLLIPDIRKKLMK